MRGYRSLCLLAFTLFLQAPIPREAAAGRDIPLAQVPEQVVVAAKKAVPGIELTEAEVKTRSNGKIYELEGTAAGKEYDIKVSAEGKVLKVSKEDHTTSSR